MPSPSSLMEPSPPISPTRIEDVTRREFMSSALVATLLIACGNDAEDDGGGSSGDGSATPRTIRDAYGSVQVPERAKRIVSMDFSITANLSVFRVAQERIVGAQFATEFATADPAYNLHAKIYDWGKIADIGTAYEPDIEKVLSVQPDLILTLGNPPNQNAGLLAESYKRLQETGVPVNAATYAYNTLQGCLEFARMAGVAVGDEAEATAAVSTIERRVADLRDRLSKRATLPNVVVLRVRPDRLTSFTHSILDELRLPGNRPSLEDFLTHISLERIGDFANADWIFLNVTSEAARTASRELTESPVFKTLPAAQAGRVVEVSSAWGGAFDLVSFRKALDDLERHLLG